MPTVPRHRHQSRETELQARTGSIAIRCPAPPPQQAPSRQPGRERTSPGAQKQRTIVPARHRKPVTVWRCDRPGAHKKAQCRLILSLAKVDMELKLRRHEWHHDESRARLARLIHMALELLTGCGMIFGASSNPRLSASGRSALSRPDLQFRWTGLNFSGGVHV